MHTDSPPLVLLPDDLPDEAAAKLIEWLYDIASALESHYAGQLLRYYHRTDPRQHQLWDECDPPF